MITEELVSFETAKLAKEKGFPQHIGNDAYITDNEYYDDTFMEGHLDRIEFIPDYYPTVTAPTQSLLQGWLREEKGYYVYPFFDNEELKWTYVVRERTGEMWLPLIGETHNFDMFEEAMDAGLKFVLENFV